MGYLFIGTIVLCLIIITVLLVIFMPRPKCYYTASEIHPAVIELEKKDFLTHIESSYASTTACNLYNNNELLIRDPITEWIVLSMPGIKSIDIKELGPSHITSKIINHKPQFGIIIPIKLSGVKKTFIWTDGEKKFFKDGQLIIYDESKEHFFQNKHKRLPTRYLHILFEIKK